MNTSELSQQPEEIVLTAPSPIDETEKTARWAGAIAICHGVVSYSMWAAVLGTALGAKDTPLARDTDFQNGLATVFILSVVEVLANIVSRMNYFRKQAMFEQMAQLR